MFARSPHFGIAVASSWFVLVRFVTPQSGYSRPTLAIAAIAAGLVGIAAWTTHRAGARCGGATIVVAIWVVALVWQIITVSNGANIGALLPTALAALLSAAVPLVRPRVG